MLSSTTTCKKKSSGTTIWTWCRERQFAKKTMSGTTTKMLSRKMTILQKYLSRRRMQNLQCISMAKYWHAVWLNIALHFLFVGKFKKAGAIKGQVIMEQLFAASYRLLPAAAVQYTFIKSNYFFLMYKLLQRSNLYTFIQWESQGKVLCLYLV